MIAFSNNFAAAELTTGFEPTNLEDNTSTPVALFLWNNSSVPWTTLLKVIKAGLSSITTSTSVFFRYTLI